MYMICKVLAQHETKELAEEEASRLSDVDSSEFFMVCPREEISKMKTKQ